MHSEGGRNRGGRVETDGKKGRGLREGERESGKERKREREMSMSRGREGELEVEGAEDTRRERGRDREGGRDRGWQVGGNVAEKILINEHGKGRIRAATTGDRGLGGGDGGCPPFSHERGAVLCLDTCWCSWLTQSRSFSPGQLYLSDSLTLAVSTFTSPASRYLSLILTSACG